MADKGPALTELMEDITEVSSTEGIERKNTIMVTRNIEASSRTVLSAVGGAIVGAVLMLIIASIGGGSLNSWTVGAIMGLACIPVGPFLFTGRVGDATRQVRYKRILNRLRSRRIEGEVFYPNSDSPENITDLEEMEVNVVS